MSKQAVGFALEAMQDDEVRTRLAAGEFSETERGQLDEHEQGLVQRAASDYPEVMPFFTLIEHATYGQQQSNSPLDQVPAVQMHGGWNEAFSYALPAVQDTQGLGG